MNLLRLTNSGTTSHSQRRRAAYALAALLLGVALVALVGCLAEDGVPAGGGSAVVTWDDVNAIFSSSACQGCHPPGGALATQQLDHFSLLNSAGSCTTNGGLMVQPGSKEQSCLWLALTKQEGSNMLNASFSKADTDLIGLWIDFGAPGP